MKKAYQGQGLHLLAIVVLLTAMSYVIKTGDILNGSLWGLTTKTWVLIGLAIPILHQIYVVVIWRLELYKQAISSRFGEKGFKVFGFIFLLFFFSTRKNFFNKIELIQLRIQPLMHIHIMKTNQKTFKAKSSHNPNKKKYYKNFFIFHFFNPKNLLTKKMIFFYV